MKRYAVYADGFQIGHAETKEKAWKIAHKYEYVGSLKRKSITKERRIK